MAHDPKDRVLPEDMDPSLHEEPFEWVDACIWELAKDMGYELSMDQVALFRESAKMKFLELKALRWVAETVVPAEPKGDEGEDDEGADE